MIGLSDILDGSARRDEYLGGMLRGLEVITPPTSEPISPDDAMAFMRVDNPDELPLIDTLIKAARSVIETRYGIAIMPQAIRATFEGGTASLRLPRLPATSLVKVERFDSSYVEQGLTGYRLESGGISPLTGSLGRALYRVTYEAGYALDAVPPEIIHALKLMVLDFYDHRGTSGDVPAGVGALMQSYQRWAV